MNVFESIMQGMEEAVAYEKGEPTARAERMTVAPVPEVSAGEIKALRQSLHMTQSMFAEVLGVSHKTVEAWEKGTNTPAGTARRMLTLLQADHSIPEKYHILY